MTKLEMTQLQWKSSGFPSEVVKAPKAAQTFDKMIVVFADESRRIIRRVSFYDSQSDKIIAHF